MELHMKNDKVQDLLDQLTKLQIEQTKILNQLVKNQSIITNKEDVNQTLEQVKPKSVQRTAVAAQLVEHIEESEEEETFSPPPPYLSIVQAFKKDTVVWITNKVTPAGRKKDKGDRRATVLYMEEKKTQLSVETRWMQYARTTLLYE